MVCYYICCVLLLHYRVYHHIMLCAYCHITLCTLTTFWIHQYCVLFHHALHCYIILCIVTLSQVYKNITIVYCLNTLFNITSTCEALPYIVHRYTYCVLSHYTVHYYSTLCTDILYCVLIHHTVNYYSTWCTDTHTVYYHIIGKKRAPQTTNIQTS